MIKTYKFAVEGTAADGQTWSTEHEFDCDFSAVFVHGMRSSFLALTEGRAVFGRPGEGCHGPYNVTKIVIEQVKP